MVALDDVPPAPGGRAFLPAALRAAKKHRYQNAIPANLNGRPPTCHPRREGGHSCPPRCVPQRNIDTKMQSRRPGMVAPRRATRAGRAGIPARRVACRKETSIPKCNHGDQEWSPSRRATPPGGRAFLPAVLRAAKNHRYQNAIPATRNGRPMSRVAVSRQDKAARAPKPP
jgi:hypothetical protein